MTLTRLRHCVDTYAVEDRATQNFGKAGLLRIDGAGADEKNAYLFFAGGPRPGVYVLDATLTLYTRGTTWAGSQTVTVNAVVEPWKERTLTWRTRPDVDATNSASEIVGSVAARTAVHIDVTAMVREAFLGTGSPFYGFELSGANGVFSSSEADDPDFRPVLAIEYTELPAAAYDLVPGEGSVISIAKPVLRWSYYDPDEGEQLSFQVQLSTSGTLASSGAFNSTVFDSGWVTSSDPELDLATTSYAGLADAALVYWHVHVQNAAGQIGPYSDPVQIRRVSKGTLVINAPTTEIEETTPVISTTLAGRDQRALEYIIERVGEGLDTDEDAEGWGNFGWGGPWGSGSGVPSSEGWGVGAWGSEPWGSPPLSLAVVSALLDVLPIYHKARFKAPTLAGASYEFEIPKKIIRKRAQTYRLTVRSWDTEINRVSTPGDLNYVEASILFSWVNPVAPPGAPTALAGITNGPGIALTWSRSAVPDHWLLMVDDIIIDQVDALDWQISGTSYGMTYYGLEPGGTHEVEIVAVVISSAVKKTSTSSTITVSTDVFATWLVDSEFGTADEPATLIRLIGDDASPSAIGEDSEDITVVGRQDVITIVDNIRGYEDEVSGCVEGNTDLLILQDWKGRPAKVLRLVMGDLNIPVRLGALSIGRVPTERGLYPVTVVVKQADEFAIQVRG